METQEFKRQQLRELGLRRRGHQFEMFCLLRKRERPKEREVDGILIFLFHSVYISVRRRRRRRLERCQSTHGHKDFWSGAGC